MKICPVEAELFYADGQIGRQTDGQTDRQTDRYKAADSRFSQFCAWVQKALRTYVTLTFNKRYIYIKVNL
jgi:hypothetical protein